jgi:hypothetical protein
MEAIPTTSFFPPASSAYHDKTLDTTLDTSLDTSLDTTHSTW